MHSFHFYFHLYFYGFCSSMYDSLLRNNPYLRTHTLSYYTGQLQTGAILYTETAKIILVYQKYELIFGPIKFLIFSMLPLQNWTLLPWSVKRYQFFFNFILLYWFFASTYLKRWRAMKRDMAIVGRVIDRWWAIQKRSH